MNTNKFSEPTAQEELTCQEFVELVTDYLEGALSTGQVTQFEEHLTECEGCEHYLDQMNQTIHLVGRLTEEAIPADGKEKLLATFRAWKQESAVGD